jgi:Gpi18-like mannosyltransferase
MIPALLAGRPFWSLLSLYWQQTGYHVQLTLNAANPYAWIPDRLSERYAGAATFLGLAVILAAVLVAARMPVTLTPDTIVATAAFSLLLVPFVLPHMHERYFYAADMLTIVLAFFRQRWAFVAVLVQVVSFLSYWPFLFGHEAVPLATLAMVETGAVVALGVLLACRLTASPRP